MNEAVRRYRLQPGQVPDGWARCRLVYRPRLGTQGTQPSRVEVVGEFSDWISPLPLELQEDGSFALDVAAPAGVYAYKFRVDGRWCLGMDEDNPGPSNAHGGQGGHDLVSTSHASLRGVGVECNRIVVLGGAAEPFVFAPAAPFVDEVEGGGVRLRLALRHGFEDPWVIYGEGGGTHQGARGEPMNRRKALVRVGDDGDLGLYEVRLPASTNSLRCSFEARTRNGAGAGAGGAVDDGVRTQTFRCALSKERRSLPDWWRKAVVYTVYVDRFRPEHDHGEWGQALAPGTAAGGHLMGLVRSLDHLENLGVSVLYCTPVHRGASAHRYDFENPFEVDSALGGEEAFAQLVGEAHRRGLRLLMDVSFSHAGKGFPPAADVLARGRASAYADWFLWGDAAGDGVKHYGRRQDAPMMNLHHPEVQAMVLQCVEQWARRGVDGLRVDMAAEMPMDLLVTLRRRFLERNPDGVVLGELVPTHAWRWHGAGALDASTDFAFHRILGDFLGRGKLSPRDAAVQLGLAAFGRGGVGAESLRFASTHDHPRMHTLVRAHGGTDAASRGALALVMLLTWPGVPALLYGEEWGLAAEVLCEEPENAWLDRMAMPWARGADCREAQAWLASLIKARRESAALAEGTVEILHAGDSLLVYRRVLGTEAVDVVLHVGQDGASLEIVDDSWGPLEPWVTVGQVRVEGDTVALGGLSAVVARRLPGGPLRNPSVIVEANRRQRDQAVRLAQVEVPLWPTRLDFSLTERCNMRCRHCITDAPRRTAKGEARSMTPWVLEKLQSAFAHVDYAGFVHGGESLTSPMLFPVLKALREARGSLGFRAHVLTNGLLLTEDVAHALVEAGVTTLSVSLDGAHAATNDAIRDGGRFQTVVERLKQVLAARRTWGKGLRVGVSMVVLQQNLGELRNMVDLVADLGADWIKFEEGVPVNEFALQSLVLADDKRLLVALEDAMAWAQRRGLVAIDHTKPLEIWRCRLANDPAKAAFLSADEFANGSEIHPCRTLWETACVEPNGDVRCGDFFGPILGNVTEVSLVDLWRRPEAQVLRQQQLEGRVCGPRGPVTCLP